MSNVLRLRHWMCIGLAVGLLGCDSASDSAGGGAPTVAMQIGSRSYHLEIAADEPSREHGLMERDSLAPDHGMIFVFPRDTTDGFWMHHTRFPLDIIFIDAGGGVVSVKHMLAYDEHTTPSDGAYRYAVELAAGQTDADGAKAGDHLTIPPSAAKTSK